MKLYIRLPGGGEIRLEREPTPREPMTWDQWSSLLLALLAALAIAGVAALSVLCVSTAL